MRSNNSAATAATCPPIDNDAVKSVVGEFLGRFGLTRRETEASLLLVQGLRAKEIAHQMACSEKMVYAHLARVCKKTGRRDQLELVCAMLAFACNRVEYDVSAAAAPRRDARTGSDPLV